MRPLFVLIEFIVILLLLTGFIAAVREIISKRKKK